MKTNFTETQKFNQWWLWLILIAVCCIPMYAIVQQIILDNGPYGNKPMSNSGLIATATLLIGLMVLFYIFKLETKIDQHTIHFKFIPFVNRTVSWKDVKHAQVVDYGFVGGWGIRLWTKYGTVYNVKGSKGLAIELHSGKRFLIGTQKEKELILFVENVASNNFQN